MSMLNALSIISKLAAIPSLIGAIQSGQSDLATLQKDPEIVKELAASPHIALRVKLISAELRTVQNDATAVKKSNFFTIFSRIPQFLKDAGKLESDIAGTKHDADIAAELANAPKLSAAISDLSVQWREVENDIHALTH